MLTSSTPHHLGQASLSFTKPPTTGNVEDITNTTAAARASGRSHRDRGLPVKGVARRLAGRLVPELSLAVCNPRIRETVPELSLAVCNPRNPDGSIILLAFFLFKTHYGDKIGQCRDCPTWEYRQDDFLFEGAVGAFFLGFV